MRSLRSRIVAGMVVLIALVFGIAVLGVTSIRSLDQSVNQELSLLLEGTDLGNGLVSAVSAEVRSAEQYLVRPAATLRDDMLEQGDSAYAIQWRYRRLASLTTSDRYIVNKIADNQAKIEVAYAMAHALSDVGRPDEARREAELARSPSDTLLGDVRALSLAQTTRSLARARDLRQQADQRRQTMWLLFVASFGIGVWIVLWTVRMVDRPLGQLIAAVERFGGGDLRPLRVERMPTELERLGGALDDMSGRLRTVVVAVVGEASQIGTSASDFSAMSEELAASSGEISTAMVKIASSAEQQVKGMEKADELLASLRQSPRPMPARPGRCRAGRPDPGSPRAPGRRGCCRSTLLDVREVVRPGGPSAGARPLLRADRVHRSHQISSNQPARPQRRHRGGSGREHRASRSWRRRYAAWLIRAAARRTWPDDSRRFGARPGASFRPWWTGWPGGGDQGGRRGGGPGEIGWEQARRGGRGGAEAAAVGS
jgi:hypothetical protein